MDEGAVEAIELHLSSGVIVLPVERVRVSDKGYSVQFSSLSLAHRRELVRIVLTRADAWLRTPRANDRPVRSLLTIGACTWQVVGEAMHSVRLRPKKKHTAQELIMFLMSSATAIFK